MFFNKQYAITTESNMLTKLFPIMLACINVQSCIAHSALAVF